VSDREFLVRLIELEARAIGPGLLCAGVLVLLAILARLTGVIGP